MNTLIAAVAGSLIVGGLIGMAVALRPVPPKTPTPTRTLGPLGKARSKVESLSPLTRRIAILGLVAGLVLALLKGWFFAIIVLPVAAVAIPVLLSAPPSGAQIAKLEALEEWTRSLSSKLTVGQSLRAALIRSMSSVPKPIEREVSLMVSRLHAGHGSTEAILRTFAEDLNDATGDVVASNLILAARGRGSTGLAAALEALAETVAADVRARRQIEADQAKPRTTARTVTAITMIVIATLAFTGDYVEPYRTPLGNIIILTLLTAYLATLFMMRRMAVAKPLPRFLDLSARAGRAQEVTGS